VKLVVITGQKGGVGKTLTAQALSTWLRRKQATWRGIDTDQENKFFADANKEEVRPYTLYDTAGRLVDETINDIVDEIAKAVEANIDVFVVDMGAGQLQALIGGMRETGLLSELGKSLELTAIYVLTQDVQSLSTLVNNHTILDGLRGTKWIVLLNERDGPVTLYLESDALRPAMAERDASEIQMPNVADKSVFRSFNESGLQLDQFLDPARQQSWAQRGRLQVWLDAFTTQFDTLAAHLAPSGPSGTKKAARGQANAAATAPTAP